MNLTAIVIGQPSAVASRLVDCSSDWSAASVVDRNSRLDRHSSYPSTNRSIAMASPVFWAILELVLLRSTVVRMSSFELRNLFEDNDLHLLASSRISSVCFTYFVGMDLRTCP